jgi:hypothetical protein
MRFPQVLQLWCVRGARYRKGFSTNFPNKSKFEWRVIVDGIETLVNNVRINTPTYTTSTFIEGAGMKWHISTKAESISIDHALANNKIAIIK